jgi:two-component system sensor histidine kinase/response regulator
MAKLLIVEDNKINRHILCSTLSSEGFVVAAAASGEEALAYIKEHEVDLVLLDVMMPGLSGFDVLKRLRESHSALELPVIMVTGKVRSHDVVAALEMGANDYVMKPVDFEVMLARLRIHLEMKRLSDLRDDFLRIASHDLKKPLAVMTDIASTLQEDYPVGSSVDEDVPLFLSHIVRSGKFMTRLIESFLDLDALEGGHIKLSTSPVNLNELVRRGCLSNVEYARRKGGTLELELAPFLPSVSADGARIEQVLDNLVGNAVKFSPLGSCTVVRTKLVDREILVEIVDRGPGLTPEDLKKVFGKYATMSNKPTGEETSSGLGLAICRHIIELHGGRIGVRNRTEGGAVFWFQLSNHKQFEENS